MRDRFHDQLQAALGSAYVVERELGGGGMSRVFVANEPALGRQVVVKVLPPELAAEMSIGRFRREIQVAARLQHPHIVPLLTAGEGSGLLYYTMPFVDGINLRDRIAREGALPLADVASVMRDVSGALAYAHRQGVVHRDIKPENILLSEGVALVADFGVAKALRASATSGDAALTSQGMVLGTPAYMAPEQALGDAGADARADLYSLGAVAYEMLSGRALFPDRSPQRLLVAHSTEAPEAIERRRAGVPPALAALIMRLLAKAPADRPLTADEVVRALDEMKPLPAAAAPTRRRIRIVVAIAVVLLAVVAATVAVRRRFPAATPVRSASIAVLPFVNMSDDKANEYFSDGMTEELIGRLANLHDMHVTALTSSFAFRGAAVNVKEVAAKLNVRNIVEGSVRRSGGRVRITASLIDAGTGFDRWTETYEADVKDVFAVQRQIATAIAGALNVVIAGRDSARLSAVPTADTAAHRLYLQGLYFWNKRTGMALRRAADLFREAIARDSTYADAYAGLAMSYAMLPYYADIPTDSLLTETRTAAHQAIRLDSTRSGPYAALAVADWFAYDWDDGLRQFDHAIALDSNDVDAHGWKGYGLLTFERYPEALAECRRAVELDPLSLHARDDIAYSLLASGDPTGAANESRGIIDLDPSFADGWIRLGMALSEIGKADSGVAMIRRGIALEGNAPYAGDLAFLAVAYVRAGRADSARRIEARLEQAAGASYVSPAALAFIDISLGHSDQAFSRLRHAIDIHDGFASNYFPMDPILRPIVSDPRFADLKRRMHLPS